MCRGWRGEGGVVERVIGVREDDRVEVEWATW